MNDATAAYRDAVDCMRGQLGATWIAFDWNSRELQWRFLRPAHRATTAQGWKIHASASAQEAHDMLRAVFAADGTQRVLAEVPPYQLTRHDLRGLDPAE